MSAYCAERVGCPVPQPSLGSLKSGMRAQIIVRAPNGARGGRLKLEGASVVGRLGLRGAQDAREAGTERPCVVDGPRVTPAEVCGITVGAGEADAVRGGQDEAGRVILTSVSETLGWRA